MSKLLMKVSGFDDQTKSVQAKFCYDDAMKTIDEYPAYSFQPTMFPDITDPVIFIRKVAQAGIHIADQQKRFEMISNDATFLNSIQDEVGKEYSFDIAELVNDGTVPPEEIV